MEETSEERLARWRSVSVLSASAALHESGKSKEFVADDGHRVKVTKDTATERGNLTVEHATKDDRVDIKVRPDVIKYTMEGK